MIDFVLQASKQMIAITIHDIRVYLPSDEDAFWDIKFIQEVTRISLPKGSLIGKLISKNRGTVKTYSRQHTRVNGFSDVDFGPRKRIRMGETGVVVIEDICSPGYSPERDDRDDLTLSTHPAQSREISPVPSHLSQSSTSITRPSSPLRSDPLFSSDNGKHSSALASPMSSPPPQESDSPPPKHEPAFRFLKRKRAAREDCTNEPLSDTTSNTVKISGPIKKGRLKQMQIDLGVELRRTCTCGMEYIPSNKEDSESHLKFHQMNARGVSVGKGFLKKTGLGKIVPKNGSWNAGEATVMVDFKSSAPAKNKARKVLELVNTELSAADLGEEQLWGGIQSSNTATKRPVGKKRKTEASINEPETRGDRFKAFLRIEGDHCVGFCLAEKISVAYRVSDPQTKTPGSGSSGPAPKSSSISHSTASDVALLGISRIWTSRANRKCGVATNLLECARNSFFYGMEVPKELMAFSQPTESGGRLATRYFGAESGWHVYSEAQVAI